jgi:hypothetical protein
MATENIAQGIGMLGSAAGMIPGIGTVISGATSLVSGALQADAAAEQRAQAEKIRKQALRTQKQALRPEFAQKLRMDKMLAQGGLAGLPLYKEQQDERLASNIRATNEIGASGGNRLAAVSAMTGAENEQLTNLMLKDAQVRQDATKRVGDTLWNIGEQERGLEDRRDLRMREGLSAAAGFENAATFNKQQGINRALSAVGSTAAGLASQAGGAKSALPTTEQTMALPNTADPSSAFQLPLSDNTADEVAPNAEGASMGEDEAAEINSAMNALLMKGSLSQEDLELVKYYRGLLKGYSTQ